jgi:hypothetical protein
MQGCDPKNSTRAVTIILGLCLAWREVKEIQTNLNSRCSDNKEHSLIAAMERPHCMKEAGLLRNNVKCNTQIIQRKKASHPTTPLELHDKVFMCNEIRI